MVSEKIQHDGVFLIGGQGLARKETLPTEKTEARDLLRACRIPSCDPRYLSDMLHETQKQPATRLSEGCILYFSPDSLRASLSRHEELIADTTSPQSSFDISKGSRFSSSRTQRLEYAHLSLVRSKQKRSLAFKIICFPQQQI